MRLQLPAAHFCPSGMYCFALSAADKLRAGSSRSGSSSKLTQPSFPLVSFHTGSKTSWACFTSLSVMAQAMASSSCPALAKALMSASKRPVFSKSEMMMGLEVAPVAPSARLLAIKSGSTESSQTLVPDAASDCSGVIGRDLEYSPWGVSL